MKSSVLKLLSGAAFIFLLLCAGCNRVPPVEPVAAQAGSSSAAVIKDSPAVQPAAVVTQPSFSVPGFESPWRVSTYSRASGSETVISTLSTSGSLTLFVRKMEGKVECILGSGDMMDSFDPASKRRAPLRYRFDDGETLTDEWMISEHSTSLRMIGDTQQFVGKIHRARKLEVQFLKPGDVFGSDTFNLALFPETVLTASAKTQ